MPTGPGGQPLPYGPQGGPMPGPMPGGPPHVGPTGPPPGSSPIVEAFARNGGDAFAVRDPSQAEAVRRTAEEMGIPEEHVIREVENELSNNFGEREGEPPQGAGMYDLERGVAAAGGGQKLLAQQGSPQYMPNRGG